MPAFRHVMSGSRAYIKNGLFRKTTIFHIIQTMYHMGYNASILHILPNGIK